MDDIKVTTTLTSDSDGHTVTIAVDPRPPQTVESYASTLVDAAGNALSEFENPGKAVRKALTSAGLIPDNTGASLPPERERAPQTLLDITRLSQAEEAVNNLRAVVQKYRGQLDTVETELRTVCKYNVATAKLAHIVATDLKQTRKELTSEWDMSKQITASLADTVNKLQVVRPHMLAPPPVIAASIVEELLDVRGDLSSQKAECARLAALNKEAVESVDHARTRATDAERSLRNTLEALRSVYPAMGGTVEDFARSCVAELKLARQSVKDLSAVHISLAELAPPGAGFDTTEQAQRAVKELVGLRTASMTRDLAHASTIRTYEEQVTSLKNLLRNAITSLQNLLRNAMISHDTTS